MSNCKKEFAEPQIKITKFEINNAIITNSGITLPDEPLKELQNSTDELITE